MKRRIFINLLLGLFFCGFITAQPAERLIKVNIAPQHADWLYKTGETVKFDVTITKNDVLMKDITITYEVGPEMMIPTKKETTTLKDGKITIDGGTMRVPGFLRCRVIATYDGKNYDGLATAGFSPEAIQPTTTVPTDFKEFWDNGKADLSKVPLDARATLLPERCTGTVDVYHVNIQGYRNSRVYGILSVPKQPGKYPALLKVPGAGVRPYGSDIANANRGAIVLEIGIHGVPVIMEQYIYDNLSNGALSSYWWYGIDDKDKSYYKRVYLNCVRAVDYIFSLPEFDGVNLAVAGGSQGGALSIVTAGLDKRITALVAVYPALSDLTGYLNGRAGGWPHYFSEANYKVKDNNKVETSKYYDVVNFARQLTAPGFYTWGYNDVTCPPTSMFSAYNVIKAPKTLFLAEETGHWTYPEQWEKGWNWLFELFKK